MPRVPVKNKTKGITERINPTLPNTMGILRLDFSSV